MTNFRDHEMTQFCWCKPRVEEIEPKHYGIYHHHRTLTRDSEPRAAARLIEGVPV